MPSHRSLRIAEAIREVVSQSILFEVSDPRVQSVTVLHVEVTGDLHNATVYVSIMGDATQQRLSLRGLEHATGFLQARVAARLQTRSTPTLRFKVDDSVKKSVSMSRLIEETLAADRAARGADPGPADEDEDANASADAGDDDGPGPASSGRTDDQR